jgi:hypothetical protein
MIGGELMRMKTRVVAFACHDAEHQWVNLLANRAKIIGNDPPDPNTWLLSVTLQ